MYWQDTGNSQNKFVVPDDIVDLSFKVQCKQLPLDHAYALSTAIQQKLPWFKDEPQAGMHLIHGAESGNGWIRPQGPGATLVLSRRTRFRLRLPKHRVDDAKRVVDKDIDIDGSSLRLSDPSEKLLTTSRTVFSRYVVTDSVQDETGFLNQVAQQLTTLGIRVKKMMSGRAHVLHMPDTNLNTRSLMIDGLEVEESIYLQQQGLGDGRKVGCGLFLPHKGIDAVGQAQEK